MLEKSRSYAFNSQFLCEVCYWMDCSWNVFFSITENNALTSVHFQAKNAPTCRGSLWRVYACICILVRVYTGVCAYLARVYACICVLVRNAHEIRLYIRVCECVYMLVRML